MRSGRRQRQEDQEDRLNEAKAAAEALAERRPKVERQISLVDRLTRGWKRVHQRNHLAEIFHQQGGI